MPSWQGRGGMLECATWKQALTLLLENAVIIGLLVYIVGRGGRV